MNKSRRKQIESVIGKLEEIKSEIDMIREEEQDCLWNMPENLQNSDRYQMSEEAVSNMEGAMDDLDEVIELLEGAME